MLARYNGNVVPFADDATSTNRTVFGGTTQSDSIDDNLNADFKKGWEIVGLNDNPTREDFNAMGYTLGALTAYLYEMGISEWNASQNYRINSRVIGSDGKIYKALTGTTGTPNINHNPTSDTVNWEWEFKAITNYSALTAKTTPVNDDLFAIGDSTSSFSLKKLTWDNIKTALDNLYVKLTGNQSINGIKTFVSKILTPNVSYKDTPISITSWSYSGSTITLNVSSHTFVSGDYIEVFGLTATTYAPNGIFLVTSVTSTTIVFTAVNTPTGTAGVSSASVKGYATVNGRTNGVGEGQTWQDVTASRALGVTYTNSTGKPIELCLAFVGNDVASANFVLNGISFSLFSSNAVQTTAQTFTVVIPNGNTYKLNATSLQKWLELR